jgi:hypothetical protein
VLRARRGSQGVRVPIAHVFGGTNKTARDFSNCARVYLERGHAVITPCSLDSALSAGFAAREHQNASRRALGGLVLVTLGPGSRASRTSAYGWPGITHDTAVVKLNPPGTHRPEGRQIFELSFFDSNLADAFGDGPPPVAGATVAQQHEAMLAELPTFEQVRNHLNGDESAWQNVPRSGAQSRQIAPYGAARRGGQGQNWAVVARKGGGGRGGRGGGRGGGGGGHWRGGDGSGAGADAHGDRGGAHGHGGRNGAGGQGSGSFSGMTQERARALLEEGIERGTALAVARMREEGPGALVVGGPTEAVITVAQHEAAMLGNRQRYEGLVARVDGIVVVQAANVAAAETSVARLYTEANRVATALAVCETSVQAVTGVAQDALAMAKKSAANNILLMEMIADAKREQTALEERVKRAFELGKPPEDQTALEEGAYTTALATAADGDDSAFSDANDEGSAPKRVCINTVPPAGDGDD